MPDMIDFLAGLQADGDTITLDGEPVCYVLGHTGRQVSTVEAAEWIVTAAHEYARFAEVIAAIKIKVAKRAAHVATYGKPYRAENEHLFRERMDAEYDLEEKIAAALKEGNADG